MNRVVINAQTGEITFVEVPDIDIVEVSEPSLQERVDYMEEVLTVKGVLP